MTYPNRLTGAANTLWLTHSDRCLKVYPKPSSTVAVPESRDAHLRRLQHVSGKPGRSRRLPVTAVDETIYAPSKERNRHRTTHQQSMDSSSEPLRVWTVPIPQGQRDLCVMMYPNQVRLCMLSQVSPGLVRNRFGYMLRDRPGPLGFSRTHMIQLLTNPCVLLHRSENLPGIRTQPSEVQLTEWALSWGS